MYWYNGELIDDERISLGIDDIGLLYGATLFTTLRIYQQSLDHPLTIGKNISNVCTLVYKFSTGPLPIGSEFAKEPKNYPDSILS